MLTLGMNVLVIFLGLWLPKTALEQQDSADGQSDHKLVKNRYIRSPETQETGRCSYTFIVPQQKITGAVCLSTKGYESPGVNRSELQELRDLMNRQQRQIEHLKQLVEVDGGLVNEVKSLRKESRNMNSRVTQLYTQLLHEIIQKKESEVEVAVLENRILNASSEVFKMVTKYRELQQKYGALAGLINNQSVVIAWLEKQCQQNANGQGQPIHLPPLVNVVPVNPTGNFSANRDNMLSSNEIQKDQMASNSGSQDEKQLNQQFLSASSMTLSLPSAAPSGPTATKSPGPWQDCQHVLQDGGASSGIYLIKPVNVNQMMQVWCEQQYQGGGWAVIQRRQDGSVNFFRNWEHYKQGFGNIDGEYWLGLDNIHWLTNQGDYRLLIVMEDWQRRQVYAEYDSFRIESESDFYRLQLGNYQGNGGDSLSWHTNKQFTTLDKDRDAYAGNCAHFQKGGWWYHMCAHSNLNGVWYKGGHYRSRYQDGVYWAEFRGGSYSLKKVSMMIRQNK
ncbi:angiopoietin-related protein 6 [Protopterus annectens]|uniref:angiopoietin-related protein 6 n=1 Tax=Protopterus annectens TaxID=7888 RepID=UPI001CF9C2AB|nr:angiopoietin-related protein 6 [Protopterus annectens]